MNREEIADYTAGYDDCMADMMQTLDEIRAEIIEERKGYPPSADEYKIINKVLQIIDKHIGDKEWQEDV